MQRRNGSGFRYGGAQPVAAGQQREALLTAAGRLAAEYLVNRGDLPPTVLEDRLPAPIPLQPACLLRSRCPLQSRVEGDLAFVGVVDQIKGRAEEEAKTRTRHKRSQCITQKKSPPPILQPQ